MPHRLTGGRGGCWGGESEEAEEDRREREETEDDTEEESEELKRMRRKRVRRRRRVTAKKTSTWRMTKIRKEKVVEGRRGGIVDFMAAKPVPSLCMGPVQPLGDNRVG